MSVQARDTYLVTNVSMAVAVTGLAKLFTISRTTKVTNFTMVTFATRGHLLAIGTNGLLASGSDFQ